MSCKTLKLKNCEIKGATFQGRRFDFVNKVITNDTFKAKVYNSEGVLKTEITGLKSGSVVYFPFTTLETYDKGNYTIRYWAEFHLLGKFNIADEDFKIANSCPNCTTQNQPYPFVLDLGEDIVKFNMSFVYIQIGSGGGDIDLTAYLTKEEAAETYQPKGNYASANHNHSDKANNDASNISEEDAELWRTKLNVPTGGGGAELPPGTDGQIYEIDNSLPEKIKPSDRLTTAENEIDAEIVNRVFADNDLQSQITTEKNRNDTQDGQITANTNAIADLYIGQAKITTTTSITTNTLSTTSNLKQNGRNVLIANGVNAINITCETIIEAKFQAIYHKLGSANVTFVAGADATLVLIDGTAIMTGAAGLQTASLHRDGNVFYLQISNR